MFHTAVGDSNVVTVRIEVNPPVATSSLSGHVFDSNGLGVGGIAVSAFSGPPLNASGSTCTAVDGSYSLPLPAGTYAVWIGTNGCGPQPLPRPSYRTSVSGVEVAGATVRDFTLPPIYRLSGRVVDTLGLGVGGVSVRASTFATPLTDSTVTAADGSYSLPLYAATYNVQLSFGGVSYTAETGLGLTADTVRNYTPFNE